MDFYAAPLEGITDGIWRRIFHAHFGGVEAFYAPFVSPTREFHITHREERQLLIDRDAPYRVVAQLLTKDAGVLAVALPKLRDLGFDEVNLNLGCPSGTVTAKGKGAGLLRDLEALKRLLDAAFALPDAPRLSVKTRVGFSVTEEWPRLWETLRDYPFCFLIVHPRTREEYYRGCTHPELLALCENARFPVMYNGDLFSPADTKNIAQRLPFLRGLMLGRGLIANPALARTLRGGKALCMAEIRAFHDELFDALAAEMPFQAVYGRMCEMMSYMATCFEDAAKPMKLLRKSRSPEQYRERAKALFDNCRLKKEPYFDPWER